MVQFCLNCLKMIYSHYDFKKKKEDFITIHAGHHTVSQILQIGSVQWVMNYNLISVSPCEGAD